MTRQYITQNSTIFVSSRVQSGLPITPSHHLNFIIWGIIAAADSLYGVSTSHFVFMSNHFHFIITVDTPEQKAAWQRYIKTEISHAINKLLGRRNVSVWVEGADAARVLDYEEIIERIGYTYANPANADLEDSIEQYPGVSSWDMFINERHSKICKRVPRNRICDIDGACLSITEQKNVVSMLDDEIKEEIEFKLDPYAWIASFPEVSKDDIPWLREKIIAEVKRREEEARAKRRAKNKSFIGATALRRQSMFKEHTPKKFGKKMICLSNCPERRKRFIAYYKDLCRIARETYEAWKLGDFSKRIPPGMLAPRAPALASALAIKF